MRRVPLKQISDKRRREGPEREAVRNEVLARAGWRCQAAALVPDVACAGPLDVDEIVLRSGRPGGHLDPANCQALCRAHHRWKDNHPEAAHELGLRRWSWE